MTSNHPQDCRDPQSDSGRLLEPLDFAKKPFDRLPKRILTDSRRNDMEEAALVSARSSRGLTPDPGAAQRDP